MKKFALIGVSGFVSERHLIAIKETGNKVELAYDINKNQDLLNKYFPNCTFSNKLNEFDKLLKKKKIQYLSICSPNHLHFKHILIGLKNNLNIICEKPIVINNSQIKKINNLPENKKNKINSILQLRCHPSLIKIKQKLEKKKQKNRVKLVYYTERNPKYFKSWKGIKSKSGGILMNVGVHFFDMLIWFFGDIMRTKVTKMTPELGCGFLYFKNAVVEWKLHLKKKNGTKLKVSRSININGKKVIFSKTFKDLHVLNYQKILNSKRSNLNIALRSIKLINKLNNNAI